MAATVDGKETIHEERNHHKPVSGEAGSRRRQASGGAHDTRRTHPSRPQGGPSPARQETERQEVRSTPFRPKGCKIWYIRYQVNGKRVQESSHSEKKTVAQNLLKLRLGEVQQGAYIPPV